jgi:hypothetical protein
MHAFRQTVHCRSRAIVPTVTPPIGMLQFADGRIGRCIGTVARVGDTCVQGRAIVKMLSDKLAKMLTLA